MHSVIELDSRAIKQNLKLFRELAGKSKVAPVLKANAYGHGLKEVYNILKTENLEWICVGYLSEAEFLRKQKYEGRILIVTPVFQDEFVKADLIKVDIILGDDTLLQQWLASPAKPRCHIKFDTGLSRQGFAPSQADEIAKKIKLHTALIAGVCTHFANVEDVLEQEYADLQLERFNEAAEVFAKHGITPLRHAASSASALILPASRLDMVRIGISLYGFWPSSATKLSFSKVSKDMIDLKPALEWITKVATVKMIMAGEFVGYGCTYKTLADTKIAVLPVGYAEGYIRQAGDSPSYVLIHGQRCRIIGRISMNMMVVDVSHIAQIQRGDAVTLIGVDKKEKLDASTVASWAKTIQYEFVARLHADIPRQVI